MALLICMGVLMLAYALELGGLRWTAEEKREHYQQCMARRGWYPDGEVPDDDPESLPIVVLTGRHGVTGADQRIVGAIRRPAGMHELYRLIQQVMEETPRSTPRVPTHLPVSMLKGSSIFSTRPVVATTPTAMARSHLPRAKVD